MTDDLICKVGQQERWRREWAEWGGNRGRKEEGTGCRKW